MCILLLKKNNKLMYIEVKYKIKMKLFNNININIK